MARQAEPFGLFRRDQQIDHLISCRTFNRPYASARTELQPRSLPFAIGAFGSALDGVTLVHYGNR